MKRINYLIILIVLVLSGCRKKDFPASDTTPLSDFYFSGTIAGEAVNLKAGTDNYYMYSSYVYEMDSLCRFTAELKPNNCSACKNSLQISIYNFNYSLPSAEVKIDSALKAKSYPILSNLSYAVQFKSSFNQQASSYLWSFGDGHNSSEANPLHVYSGPGNYSVSLRINATNGCQQYISNVEKIRVPADNLQILATRESANVLTFSASVLGLAPSNYFWDFGDGTSSTSARPTHTYNIAGTYPVSLRVPGSLQDTITARYNAATLTGPMPCLSNYYISSITQVLSPSLFSKVVINWTDDNGDVFTSLNLFQPASSDFKITSVNDYDANEKGEKTKKIKLSFSCTVYNGFRVKQIENAEAVLAVAYK